MCTYNANPEAEAGALSMPGQYGLRMGFGICHMQALGSIPSSKE